jgi:hypothetical protein
MQKTKRFQDATESLNQINLWQKELEDKELRLRLLIQEKGHKDCVKQPTKEDNYRQTPAGISKPGLW